MKRRIAILGCGSIGMRHAKNLRNILGDELDLLACDRSETRMRAMVDEHGATAWDPMSNHLLPIDCILICTPPNTHQMFMQRAVDIGSHMFVEKPLAMSLTSELVTVLGEAEAKGLQVMVGYQLRFNPGILTLKKTMSTEIVGKPVAIMAEFGYSLPKWHPDEDYRLLHYADTGIILEASHEIDYVRWLTGSKVIKSKGVIGNLAIQGIIAEDLAEISLCFANGMIAGIHLDMIQSEHVRTCKVICTEGNLLWNYRHNHGIWISQENGAHFIPSEFSDTRDDYQVEMKCLLDTLDGNKWPGTNGYDALETLRIAMKLKGVDEPWAGI